MHDAMMSMGAHDCSSLNSYSAPSPETLSTSTSILAAPGIRNFTKVIRGLGFGLGFAVAILVIAMLNIVQKRY
ncbi:hypothetical protein NA56DRAFT_712562 [Hyaloscypha hepaticicola]|uniref:Uncharacterized protein n=1 Tax=Hyaloscypha hepaticicola TaxID=2082293 RepID=A0A2J6PFY1_9HELO|nr:hypothetical protein NA56DRAFT_712562 [Hyaloscypha hepaticicola]